MSDDKDWKAIGDEQWKQELSQEAYLVTRKGHTEPPFSGEYNDFKEMGTYSCICCNTPLFLSEFKFDSGCGWPAFFKELPQAHIIRREDLSHGRIRTEILCGKCDAHLGHVFQDGPPPTGERYCVNSVAMRFELYDPQ